MTKYLSKLSLFCSLLFLFAFSIPSWAETTHSSSADRTWHYVNAQGELKIKLYFFWSKTCPHCAEAHPFIDSLPQKYPWIELESHRVSDPGVQDIWQNIASKTSTEARSVPYMASCEKAIVGYSSEAVTGEFLVNRLKNCYLSLGGKLSDADLPTKGATSTTTSAQTDAPLFGTCGTDTGEGTCDATSLSEPVAEPEVQPVELPLVGVVTPETMSLPLLTLVLAGVDAFNPCAFFVLLFLLSIMVNAKSRSRMLLVGGIFVFFSGFIYFLFMTAWLNIFQLLGAGSDGGMIILAAGCLALIAGVINIKDYFFTKGEVTLSMSAENRTSLIKRMGKLSNSSNLGALLIGSTVLAILANAYELLCTAGFPMIYTSVLSMHNLPDIERYMYLVLYNIVYVIPLAIIVIVFSATLGKRKLTEKEGQTLKLMSGVMMLGMGIALVIDPTALQNVSLALGLILGSLGVTAIIVIGRKLFTAKAK
ncbi:cytochrome C biosynthesis protein [Shewanella sp. SW36]|uniref:cytochrome C biosynthesis protein n=1 Tax=Shewanella TaxID=22 RepID=UPI0021D7F4C9|nr:MULTISPECIES: cytochrome C biosynthesis protein [unclassified Shewanella]MCU7975990.1 cytochrome C biosynthesis protein [Shewanella sp. SW36]MCU7991380.1 cytochrome C biosynthesis protein [Shewanella sp. SW1]MCU8016623.1 cytochrome C biosynthesis protein [Shewanella sp. SM72]MCU8052889.1 cytochrome C biosynthesis protein [Shewanella sp. SM43]